MLGTITLILMIIATIFCSISIAIVYTHDLFKEMKEIIDKGNNEEIESDIPGFEGTLEQLNNLKINKEEE